MKHDVLGHLAVGVDVDALVVVAEQQLHPVGVGQRDDGVGHDGPLGMLWCVDVVDGGRVEVDSVEAGGRAVENFETSALLHCEIYQEWFVLQLAERLEGHEFVVGFRRPGVDFDGVSQGNDQELDTLILDNLEVNSTLKAKIMILVGYFQSGNFRLIYLEVTNIDPSRTPLNGVVRPENLGL